MDLCCTICKCSFPKDCIIDKFGKSTRKPEDYFNGGAILPSGAQKGYRLALIGELIGEALLGPSTTDANWLLVSTDTSNIDIAQKFMKLLKIF